MVCEFYLKLFQKIHQSFTVRIPFPSLKHSILCTYSPRRSICDAYVCLCMGFQVKFTFAVLGLWSFKFPVEPTVHSSRRNSFLSRILSSFPRQLFDILIMDNKSVSNNARIKRFEEIKLLSSNRLLQRTMSQLQVKCTLHKEHTIFSVSLFSDTNRSDTC